MIRIKEIRDVKNFTKQRNSIPILIRKYKDDKTL